MKFLQTHHNQRESWILGSLCTLLTTDLQVLQGLLQRAEDQRNGLILLTDVFVCVERSGEKKNINSARFLPGQEKREVALVAIRKSHGFI